MEFGLITIFEEAKDGLKGGIWLERKYSKASLTVEAALVLPIFIFATVSVIYINRLLFYEEEVEWALVRIGREVSVEYAAIQNEAVVNPVYLMGKMRGYARESGSRIQMFRSHFDAETDEIELVADYSTEIPFPIFGRNFTSSHRCRTRAFTGVETRMAEEDKDGEQIVYVTKTGKVYHKKLECTYLTLRISQVKYGDLEYLRSENGAKYYACESCCVSQSFAAAQNVFVCNYGDRFHCFRTCKKIKRSIEEIHLSEAGGRLPCSKCGGDD